MWQYRWMHWESSRRYSSFCRLKSLENSKHCMDTMEFHMNLIPFIHHFIILNLGLYFHLDDFRRYLFETSFASFSNNTFFDFQMFFSSKYRSLYVNLNHLFFFRSGQTWYSVWHTACNQYLFGELMSHPYSLHFRQTV